MGPLAHMVSVPVIRWIKKRVLEINPLRRILHILSLSHQQLSWGEAGGMESSDTEHQVSPLVPLLGVARKQETPSGPSLPMSLMVASTKNSHQQEPYT